MTGNHWYVVHTQPQSEKRAEFNLRQQGFKTYLPCYLRNRRHARRVEVVPRPLFPRYMFVDLDLEKDRWRSIQSTFGVSGLVLNGDVPASVSDEILDEIRNREDDRGYVTLGLPAGIGPGSRVRLADGIFAESKGIIDRIADGCRVAILLEMLGREVRVFVPAAAVRTI